MKSAWDKIFNTDAPLTNEERDQAFRELAEAVTSVDRVQATPEHERIAKLIQGKLGNAE